MSSITKVCTTCGRDLLLTEYGSAHSKKYPGLLRGECKKCENMKAYIRHKSRKREYLDKHSAAQREYWANLSPEKRAEQASKRRVRRLKKTMERADD